MTAWAKALNACQTADLLENRNSDRPSHSPAHIGPGADVGDRQRKLLSCIFRFTPGRLSRLDRVSEYRASVCLCVPLFSHFGGATANRQVPAPITAKEAAVRHGGAGGHRVRGSASSLVCSQTQVSGLPRREGPDWQEDYAKVERKTSAFAEMPSTKGKHTLLKTRAHRLLSNALQPNHSNALRRGGVGCR
jgi:hypothetical protein